MRRTKLPSIGEALRKIRSNKYHFFFPPPPLLKNFLPNTVIFVHTNIKNSYYSFPSSFSSNYGFQKKACKIISSAIRVDGERQLGEILNEIRKHFDT